MKLLVRNLARTTSEQAIHDLFSPYGVITECTLVLDQVTGKSKGFGFVEMPDENEAMTALHCLNLTEVDNKTIRVKRTQS